MAKRGFVTKYRTYNYITKNPVIDKVRTILQDEGLYTRKKRNVLSQLSGVAMGTFEGWFEGDTKNPQHGTIMATLTSIGYEEKFVKTEKLDFEAELEKAAAWRKRQQAARENARA